MLTVKDGKLLSPFYSEYEWEIGWHKAEGDYKIVLGPAKFVCGVVKSMEGGVIHVFTSLGRANRCLSSFSESLKCGLNEIVIVEIECRGFVARGYLEEAAFKEVYLSQEEYNKALGIKGDAAAVGAEQELEPALV